MAKPERSNLEERFNELQRDVTVTELALEGLASIAENSSVNQDEVYHLKGFVGCIGDRLRGLGEDVVALQQAKVGAERKS